MEFLPTNLALYISLSIKYYNVAVWYWYKYLLAIISDSKH